MQASLARINFAESQFLDGNLDGADNHAYGILRREVETAPPSIKVFALFKIAKVCACLNRYVEAQEALQHLSRLLKDGKSAGSTYVYKSRLCLAQIRFDQGRYNEARAIVEKIDIRHCSDEIVSGKYHTILGQLLGVDMHTRHHAAQENGASLEPDTTITLRSLLEIAVGHQMQAITMFTNTNNYQLMQNAFLNLGNLYLHTYRMFPDASDQEDLLDLGIGCLVQCELICSKFGVGMNSNRKRIALIKLMLDGRLELSELNRRTGGMFKHHSGIEDMAQAVLVEITRVGNRLELAEMLIVMAELARNDAGKAESYRQQAVEIYRNLKRPDLIRQLKKDSPMKPALPVLRYGS